MGHFDIKPANVLIKWYARGQFKGSQVVLSDFGLTREFRKNGELRVANVASCECCELRAVRCELLRAASVANVASCCELLRAASVANVVSCCELQGVMGCELLRAARVVNVTTFAPTCIQANIMVTGGELPISSVPN